MPSTINGIGTHYYGKRDRKSELGVCSHCGRNVELQSYETTLWFVVFFIPVIPLGRKRVMDYCPRCTRHYVMEPDKWQKLRHETLEENMRKMREKPDDPDAAIEMHAALDAFGKRDETRKLAEFMKERFVENAPVQMHLGHWYMRMGDDAAAEVCLERALALDPDNRAARRAVGMGCILKGDLDHARELFSFMAESGPDRSAASLLALAAAYRRRGDHETALDVCGDALEWLPEATGQNKAFRQEVRLNEKALKATDSILPKRKPPTRLIATAASILVLIGLGFLVLNLVLARTQTLHIINVLPASATVELAGRDPIEAAPNAHLTIRIAEGDYSAVVTLPGGVPRSTAFSISNSLKQRFRRKNVFILNVGGAAAFLWEKARYGPSSNPNERFPYELHVNRDFLAFRDIDYAFEPFPNTIQSESSGSLWRTHVEILRIRPDQLMSLMNQEGLDVEETLQFAETHLEAAPRNHELLLAYFRTFSFHDRMARGFAFLKKGLHHRPTIIDWHRYYQTAAAREETAEELIAEYDALLQEAPNDAGRLYLRGRISGSAKESFSYYDKALAADPDNPYPKSAKAYHLAGIGRLDEALALSQAACAHKSATFEMTNLLYTIRKLHGDHKALAEEAATALKKTPTDAAALLRLMENTLPLGETESARAAMDALIRESAKETPPEAVEAIRSSFQLQFDYLRGDIDAYVEHVAALPDATMRRHAAYVAHMTKLEMPEADALYEAAWDATGHLPVLHAIGWLARGDTNAAAPWLADAATVLENSEPEGRILTQMLRNPSGPVLERLDDLVIYPSQKRILYTVFAALSATEREPLLARADALSADCSQPHLFLARATKELRKAGKTKDGQ